MTSFTSNDHTSRRSFLGATVAAVAAPKLLRQIRRQVGPTLSLPPFLSRPTTSSILIDTQNGHDAVTGIVELRHANSMDWLTTGETVRAAAGDSMRWHIDGLEPGSRYEYRISLTTDAGDLWPMVRGNFVTQRVGDESYTAALITDAHMGTFVYGSAPNQVTDDVISNVRLDRPEFVLALGDNVAWSTSRNQPQKTPDGAERAYTMYRRHVGPLTRTCPHFGLIGNWEGETGKFPTESLEMISTVRKRFAPNPNHETYAEGGSHDEDYYAFTWGPVLYVILNVQTYTTLSAPTDNPRDDVLAPDEWTLGQQQFAWMERTLANSSHPFKFVCIHHAVGGNAGNDTESLYGRGGAQAAGVGEQRRVHELMREHGVQIMFYGHDHVFVDDVVDDVHYALPGSFGAPWKFERSVTGYDRYWPDSGHARLIVQPNEARVEFVNQSGSPFHTFIVTPRG